MMIPVLRVRRDVGPLWRYTFRLSGSVKVSDFSPVVISNPTLTWKVVGYESSDGVGGECLSCMGRAPVLS